MRTMAKKLGITLSLLHSAAFAATAAYVHFSTAAQAPLVWTRWFVVDLPVSLLYYLGHTNYPEWSAAQNNPLAAQLLYLPHLIHGLLGTIWWYFLPRLFLPKRFGGVWKGVGR
jgi:hypothetical protein